MIILIYYYCDLYFPACKCPFLYTQTRICWKFLTCTSKCFITNRSYIEVKPLRLFSIILEVFYIPLLHCFGLQF